MKNDPYRRCSMSDMYHIILARNRHLLLPSVKSFLMYECIHSNTVFDMRSTELHTLYYTVYYGDSFFF